ncbi:MAG TPA: copper resistance protein CopC, partial [Candidatus Limnocylindrales bacterium]
TGLGLSLALAFAALASSPAPAGAHALPQSSSPSPGSNLATPPSRVTITFGERPDPKLSTINVLDKAGAPVVAGPTVPSEGDPLSLTVPLKPLPTGVYTVAWRTVSAVDGHLASGSFAFGVGAAPSAGASQPAGGGSSVSGSGGPSILEIVGRWLLYLGLLAILGTAFFGIVVGATTHAIARWILPIAWFVAAVGTATVIGAQVASAGVSPSEVFGTSFGPAIIGRVLPLAFILLVVLAIWRQGRAGRASLMLAGLGAAACLMADVGTSHAAAGHNVVVDVILQGAHVLAVGLWLGGLVALLLWSRREPGPETARAARLFSRTATAGIATVAITGVIRAIEEVGSVDALLGTDFGRLIVAKSAVLVVVAALGAINHFQNVPAAGRSLTGLRRAGSVEVLLLASALLLSGALVNIAPPAAAGGNAARAQPGPSPSAGPLLVEGHDFGTSVRIRLAISPGAAGFNTFSATVTDYDSGAPVSAYGITLRFAIPARADVGGSRLDLAPAGAGAFSATGSNLSLDGAWQVTALVARGASSVEVPLELITRTPAPQIDANAVAGLPTIYTVHLSAGRTVQVYLDPGAAGGNEVHATFFDPAGNELPVPSVVMIMGPIGRPASLLPSRQLEPGHFVADTTLEAGSYTLSIAGPAPNGDQLATQLDLPVAAAPPSPGSSPSAAPSS